MIATAFEDTVIIRSYVGDLGTATLIADKDLITDKDTGNLSYQAEGDTADTPILISEVGDLYYYQWHGE